MEGTTSTKPGKLWKLIFSEKFENKSNFKTFNYFWKNRSKMLLLHVNPQNNVEFNNSTDCDAAKLKNYFTYNN